jgi:hypothetical protein
LNISRFVNKMPPVRKMAPYTGFSKSRCGSPGAHLLDELEEELEAAAAIAALPIIPGPVALPEPPDNSAAVGFDMAALLVNKAYSWSYISNIILFLLLAFSGWR